jgi:putative membrane protein
MKCAASSVHTGDQDGEEVVVMMGLYGGGLGWLMMMLSSVLGLVVIGLVVWAIVRVTHTEQQQDRTVQPTAREILDRRFASGDIDAESYRAAVRELSASGRG